MKVDAFMHGGQAINPLRHPHLPFAATNHAIGEHFKTGESIATHPRSIALSITSDVIVCGSISPDI